MTEAKWHWEEITFNHPTERVPLSVVSDGAIANVRVANGKLIPVLLIDTSSRPDIEDLIKAHKYISPGDVKSNWGKFSRESNTINLVLLFERPSKCIAILEFNILKHGGIVGQIVLSEALYLQSGKEGERVSSTLDREKILVEVPSKKFQPEWNNILFKALETDEKKKGMSKRQAKDYSSSVIKEWRKLGEMRKKE